MPAITNYAGRFKLWDRPAVYPQVDLVNGAPEGPVFDLDVNTESGGATYLRQDHVEEMARTLGWMSPEEVQTLKDENDKLQNQILNLPNAIEELKDAIDSRVSDFYTRLDYRPHLSVDDTEDDDSNNEGTDGDSFNAESDDLESFGLSSLERPNDVSGNSGNGKSGKSGSKA